MTKNKKEGTLNKIDIFVSIYIYKRLLTLILYLNLCSLGFFVFAYATDVKDLIILNNVCGHSI